ncbi:MAG TPA: hypothetical protein VHY56_02080, partial [Candidatus Binataceae bacterium]|nr:hypothetical protein [Candidatus Binataceae bacterium]
MTLLAFSEETLPPPSPDASPSGGAWPSAAGSPGVAASPNAASSPAGAATSPQAAASPAASGDTAEPNANWTRVPNAAPATVASSPVAGAAASSSDASAGGGSAVSAAPPPALDASTIATGLDPSQTSLTDQIKHADNPALAASLRATEQARKQLAAGQLDEALRSLGPAVSIDPSNP